MVNTNNIDLNTLTKVKSKRGNVVIYIRIYKENYPFEYFWVGIFFSKILSIFNTNNTYNK